MSRLANSAIATSADARAEASHRMTGLLIVSLFPALFWMATIAGAGSALGHAPSTATLLLIGTSVAGICGGVATLLARAAQD